jgi:hypothetical protein
MPRKKLLFGPISNAWVDEVRTSDGTKFVARWQYYVVDPAEPDGRRRERGHYEIGPKVYDGPEDALKSQTAAEKKWAAIRDTVMGRTEELPACLKAEKTFRWFAEEDPDGFRKRREERWSGSTPEWYDYITKEIFARFGETRIKDLEPQRAWNLPKNAGNRASSPRANLETFNMTNPLLRIFLYGIRSWRATWWNCACGPRQVQFVSHSDAFLPSVNRLSEIEVDAPEQMVTHYHSLFGSRNPDQH